jgi:fluoride exporter
MSLVLIAVGGAGGAVARYLVDTFVSTAVVGAFPWGTLVVNLSGSIVLGILFAIVLEQGLLPSSARAALMVGFLGAYTTFSTLMLESWRLVEGGAPLLGLVNILGSTVLGMVAVVAGLTIGRTIA